MALNIGDALRTGYERTVARNGLTLVLAFFLIQSITSIASTALAIGAARTTGAAALTPYVAAWSLILLFGGLVNIAAIIGTLRVFSTEERQELRYSQFRDRLGTTFLNFIIGSILFGVLVGFGFLLFVIPGVFLAVSLLFWGIYVAVEDQGFYQAMESSWTLATGNRWDLLFLGLGVAVLDLFIGLIFSIPSGVFGFFSPFVGSIITSFGASFAGVFTLAVIVEAYKQLSD